MTNDQHITNLKKLRSFHNGSYGESINAAVKALEELKTGYWKRISIDKYSEHSKYWYRCDRCGKDNLGNTDFCPNCGAKMDGEEKNDRK